MCQEEVSRHGDQSGSVRSWSSPRRRADLDLYDLDLDGGVLQVLVDRPVAPTSAPSPLARTISRALDEHDPIDGNYTLEVSTPGSSARCAPRPLRRRLGTTVKVKTKPGTDGERRVEGTITAADDTSVTVQNADGDRAHLRYDDIERARTTFEWGGAAKKKRKKAKA